MVDPLQLLELIIALEPALSEKQNIHASKEKKILPTKKTPAKYISFSFPLVCSLNTYYCDFISRQRLVVFYEHLRLL
jgi:hypothetical protein